MGQAKSKIRVPREKLALSIGVSDYSFSNGKYRSLMNPAQNAFQMVNFFKKHDYNVTTNIRDYNDVIEKTGQCNVEELIQVLDGYLEKCSKCKKRKQKLHIFIYYSGIVTYTADTNELCGIDSYGNLIQLQRYSEIFAQHKYVFTVFYVEGVYFKDPKRFIEANKHKVIGQSFLLDSSIMSMSKSARENQPLLGNDKNTAGL